MLQMKKPCRNIALMDSNPIIRTGLKALLDSIGLPFEVLIEESSLRKLSEALMYHSVDLLITDLQSSHEDINEGLDILLTLSVKLPDMAILVYTSSDNSHKLRNILKNKAIHVIARGETMDDTKHYFKLAFNSKYIISPKIISSLACEDYENLFSKLTYAEASVIRCLINGISLQDVANLKNLSVKTISAQKRSAMRKLKVKSDSELFRVINFLNNGLKLDTMT